LKRLSLIVMAILVLALGGRSFAQGDYASPEDVSAMSGEESSGEEGDAQPVAKKKKSKKKKAGGSGGGQDAVVKTDAAAVYDGANFDSTVTEYLDAGKKVRISKKTYPGGGGIGVFYKVKIGKTIGYITDIDVEIKGAGGKKSKKKLAEDEGEEAPDPMKLQDEDEGENENPEGAPNDSTYYNTFWGLSFSSVAYAEEIASKTETENVAMVGLRRQGPVGMLGGLPLDFDLLFTSSPPGFYDDFSTKTTGFMVMSNMLVSIPLYDSQSFIVRLGLGPSIRFSNWSVTLEQFADKPPVESQESTLGGTAGLGFGLRFGRVMLAADGRYTYETQSYMSYVGSLLFQL
jgi:hypothetical protein